MSIFGVIYVIYLPELTFSPAPKEFSDVFEERETDDGSYDRATNSEHSRRIGRDTEEINRFYIYILSCYRFSAFLVTDFIYEPQIQPDRPTIDSHIHWADTPIERDCLSLLEGLA